MSHQKISLKKNAFFNFKSLHMTKSILKSETKHSNYSTQSFLERLQVFLLKKEKTCHETQNVKNVRLLTLKAKIKKKNQKN